MPTYHKPTSPKQEQQRQHSSHQDHKSAAWLGGFTAAPQRNSNSYGFIPVPVPWYAVSGLGGYQQPYFPNNSVPSGVFFPDEQLSSNMSANPGGPAATTSCEPVEVPVEGPDGGAKGTNANNNNNVGAECQNLSGDSAATATLIQTTNRAVLLEPQTDHALKFLSRHLQEAITLCEGYLQDHDSNTDAVKQYLDIASRDRLWAAFLESKFKEDESNRHMLHRLPFDVDAAVRQALNAATREKGRTKANLTAAESQQDKLDWCEKRAHEIEILRVRCGRVMKLAGMALVTLGKCKKLVEEMTLMQQTTETILATKFEG